MRVVVCAAIKIGDTILCGARHWDTVMHSQRMAMTDIRENAADRHVREQQGFIDQNGVFMDRREALEVAKAAGQIDRRRAKSQPYDQLFSEDLY